MEFKDYYKILGVEPTADTATIKTAYRKLARKYHPDMNPDKGAADKFKDVAEAYQVLKNEQTRADFDELRTYGSQSQRGFQPPPGWQASRESRQQRASATDGDFSDFFNSIFGGRGFQQAPQQARGQDIEIELPVFLEETLKENKRDIEFTLPGDDVHHVPPAKKHLNVKIPQGVIDGSKIRLKGQGKPGYNGGMAGDLYLHIRVVPHPLFDVIGNDITITIPLLPWEAALGTKITVPTLDGKISLTIPANTQSGDRLRVKGKGLKSKAKTGDMHAVVDIVMPAKTTASTNRLWQELADKETFNPREKWSAQS